MLFANAVCNVFTGGLDVRNVFNVFSMMFAKTSVFFLLLFLYSIIPFELSMIMFVSLCMVLSGAPNENIVQNHLNIALVNVF